MWWESDNGCSVVLWSPAAFQSKSNTRTFYCSPCCCLGESVQLLSFVVEWHLEMNTLIFPHSVLHVHIGTIMILLYYVLTYNHYQRGLHLNKSTFKIQSFRCNLLRPQWLDVSVPACLLCQMSHQGYDNCLQSRWLICCDIYRWMGTAADSMLEDIIW